MCGNLIFSRSGCRKRKKITSVAIILDVEKGKKLHPLPSAHHPGCKKNQKVYPSSEISNKKYREPDIITSLEQGRCGS
jgi:hypothetical protein